MTPPRLLCLAAAAALTGNLLCAKPATEPLVEPVTPPAATEPAEPPAEPPPPPAVPDAPAGRETPPPAVVPPPAGPTKTDPAKPGPAKPADGEPAAPGFGPLAEQQKEMQESDEGFIIKDASLNDIFQYLAKSGGRQYFHNTKISGPEFNVTGHLNEGEPLQQMEELAFMYGLSLHTKGNTIYALTSTQLNQLPSVEFHYQLRYLRPTDIEQIKELIKPVLSPGTGIVNFEPKTNTIIIIDSAHRIEQAQNLLHGIDRAQGQIIVETKILRINTTAAERTGINWSSSLGEQGTTLSIARDLNSVFGLPESVPSNINLAEGTNLVLSPIQLTGVLRALGEGGIASQVSNPTLITEDNEMATISIIERVPIITTTTTQSSGSAANPTVSEQVRYKIDMSDKSIDTDPDKHREIGISLVVTPTLLPDGTIRMKMRPRSAQIIDEVISVQTKNRYPHVSESMVESLARVPNGYSLVVGGFYGSIETKGRTKVPLLGDVPVINFFFKSKDNTKEKTSLVFIVTPTSYDPVSNRSARAANNRVHSGTMIGCDYDWVDTENPGPAHEPNMKRSIRGLQPTQAPYYPRPDELVVPPAPSEPAPPAPPAPRAKASLQPSSHINRAGH